ncbi:Pantothenate kinase type III [Fulvivirga imtechensis AK7]|uniref:Type III pantothenate kinase n=1 Tax=Fulvivirga imtechensis AK7 TaxID=1237149 RepID=L8JY11_9BACT|nr:type III pantothenate kinase [Fulvivirga imtechensis]ELR73665.1 Pantothenate kinase type III [Fulvivirga imtechensis AK7]
MLLAVDIGNTNVVFGIYGGGSGWPTVWRIETRDEAQDKLSRSLNKHIGDKEITGIVISSVVPFFTHIIARQLQQKYHIAPYVIGPSSYPAIPVEILSPEQIGTDLVANATAAFDMFNSDCMVVDFGTALTFTVIADQRIHGVNIAPGLKTAMKALAGNAVKLSEIPLALPESVIGKDTTTAIQSGILWGYVGLVEKMIERIEKELNKEFKVVATGGLSKVLKPLHDQFDAVEPLLTLEGMRLIYEMNKK